MFLILLIWSQWGLDNPEAKYFCPMPDYQLPRAESTHSFNVLKYELAVILPMTSRSLQGVNKIKCQSMLDGLNITALHSRTLIIDSVSVDGISAGYSTIGETLFINLPQIYNTGDSFTIEIGFHGSWSITSYQTGFVYYPKNYNVNTLHTVAYTLGEPWDARAWMPCYDEPYDKADNGCIIAVTVPDSFVVCANGELASVVNNPGGTKTFTYQENYPITTYLMHFAVSQFAKWSDWYYPTSGDSVELRYFIWPEDSVQSIVAFQYLSLAMTLFDSIYGHYPFDRYGQDAVYPFAWGGMEHQEQTTIHRWWILWQAETGMAHELAHQWWGDMITCVDFRDIWLNEGFATYSDANYQWYRFGSVDTFYSTMQSRASDYFASDAVWRHPLYDPPITELFDWGHSYCKGSWVLHMLRYLDQNNYLLALQAYRDSFEYGTASTEDLKAIFSQVYVADLTWFFDEWVYDQGYPEYEIYWDCIPSGSNYLAQIKIKQIQTNAPAVFHMPVQMLLHFLTGDTLVNIPITTSPQDVEYPVSDSVISIEFDPDYWLLKKYNVYYGIQEFASSLPGDNDIYFSNPMRRPKIEYVINQSGEIKLALYDVSGRLLKQIYQGLKNPGRYSVKISGLSTGVYFCRLKTPAGEKIKKMVVVR